MKDSCNSCQDEKGLLQTVFFLKAISDENRLRIICFLKDKEKCVCEIVNFLNISQNLVSHHLRILRDKEIVLSRKEGLNVFYSLHPQNPAKFLEFLNFLIYKK